MEGTELVLANQYSLQPKMVVQNKMVTQTKMAARKRVVSECASIIADPTQVSVNCREKCRLKCLKLICTKASKLYTIYIFFS